MQMRPFVPPKVVQMIRFAPVFADFYPVVEGGAEFMPKLSKTKGAVAQ